MKLLGVDPGSRVTGWGLLDVRGTRSVLVEAGELALGASSVALPVRLASLHVDFSELVARTRPDAAAVESPFHGVNARDALRLAHARGVIIAVLGVAGVEVAEYSPASVKKAVTGNGRATKEQVRSMVERLLGAPLAASRGDLSDALAVGLCHAAGAGMRDALARAGTARPTSRAARAPRRR